MAMDRDTGEIRPLGKDFEPATEKESVFQVGELVSLKGCVFSVEKIYPNPENKLVLLGRPANVKEADMI